jgi:hypothetical protein
LAGFSNCRARNQPFFSASSAALRTMPVPRSAAGVRITFAPSMRMIFRRSTEKVSTMTATMWLEGSPFQPLAGCEAGAFRSTMTRVSA